MGHVQLCRSSGKERRSTTELPSAGVAGGQVAGATSGSLEGLPTCLRHDGAVKISMHSDDSPQIIANTQEWQTDALTKFL